MLDLEAMLIVCLLSHTLIATFWLLLTMHEHIKRQLILDIYHKMAGIVAVWGQNGEWGGT